MVPTARPTATSTNACVSDALESRDSSKIPPSVMAKYSGGPKRTATSASQEAANMMPTTPTVPATNEPTAATASAAPARPLRVIW